MTYQCAHCNTTTTTGHCVGAVIRIIVLGGKVDWMVWKKVTRILLVRCIGQQWIIGNTTNIRGKIYHSPIGGVRHKWRPLFLLAYHFTKNFRNFLEKFPLYKWLISTIFLLCCRCFIYVLIWKLLEKCKFIQLIGHFHLIATTGRDCVWHLMKNIVRDII